MRYLHVTFLAISPVLHVSPGGGGVEGRRRGSIPPTLRGLAARGRRKLKLVAAEGRLAGAGSTLRPVAVPSLAIEAAGSVTAHFHCGGIMAGDMSPQNFRLRPKMSDRTAPTIIAMMSTFLVASGIASMV